MVSPEEDAMGGGNMQGPFGKGDNSNNLWDAKALACTAGTII
jgi:hypothetical protein